MSLWLRRKRGRRDLFSIGVSFLLVLVLLGLVVGYAVMTCQG